MTVRTRFLGHLMVVQTDDTRRSHRADMWHLWTQRPGRTIRRRRLSGLIRRNRWRKHLLLLERLRRRHEMIAGPAPARDVHMHSHVGLNTTLGHLMMAGVGFDMNGRRTVHGRLWLRLLQWLHLVHLRFGLHADFRPGRQWRRELWLQMALKDDTGRLHLLRDSVVMVAGAVSADALVHRVRILRRMRRPWRLVQVREWYDWLVRAGRYRFVV